MTASGGLRYAARMRLSATIALLLVFGGPTSSWAIPPSYCHQTLTGTMASTDPAQYPPVGIISLRLAVRNDEGDLSLSGRFRCKPVSGSPGSCEASGTSAIVDGFSGLPTDDHYGLNFRIALVDPDTSSYTVRCELHGVAAVMSTRCIPAMAGTYVCKQGSVEVDHGTFGLTAKICAVLNRRSTR